MCRSGVLGRDAAVAMNGDAAPASPSAPTPFKNSRRPILLVGGCPTGRKTRLVDVAEKLVFDPAWITDDCFSLGFMLPIFPCFSMCGKTKLGLPILIIESGPLRAE